VADAAVHCHAALQRFCRDQGVVGLRLVDEHAMALARGRSGKVQRIIAMASPPKASGRRPRRP
jgi:hypothetical protein